MNIVMLWARADLEVEPAAEDEPEGAGGRFHPTRPLRPLSHD
jgi:hypothetical protein